MLFYVFSQCGDVLGVSAKKNIHLRGQAFVVFKEAKAAEEAATKLNGQKLLGKELVKLRFTPLANLICQAGIRAYLKRQARICPTQEDRILMQAKARRLKGERQVKQTTTRYPYILIRRY